MKYRNTKRKGALLLLLNIITLGFFFLFFMIRIRREIGDFTKKKGIPFPVVWLLGIITLEIVPIIWFANRAQALEEAVKERNLNFKPVTFAFMFCWVMFGAWIIVGPFIAFHRFFNTLNALETAFNVPVAACDRKSKKKKAKKSEADKKEEKPSGIQAPDQPISNGDKPMELREPRVRFEPYRGDGEGKLWLVKADGYAHYFYRQSEAIAFAKRIATDRRMNVTVRAAERKD